MLKKLPAIQFYTGDYTKDPNLSMCSSATRGIWMDLLCAMHELNRCGQITGTTEQIARVCRCTSVEAENAIRELEQTKAANVSERNGVYTIINRRMKREFDERESAKHRMEKMRKKEVVTKSNGNVTEAQTLINKTDASKNNHCYAKVTSLSSSSSSSSTSTTTSKEKENTTDAVVKKKAVQATTTTTANIYPDEDFLDSLGEVKAYSHIPIQIEFEKAKIWCANNEREISKKFFVDWINRIQPASTNGENNGTGIQKRAGNGFRESTPDRKQREARERNVTFREIDRILDERDRVLQGAAGADSPQSFNAGESKQIN